MPLANILARYADYNECKCIHCGVVFKAGGKQCWRNHFYCSQGCANAHNTCSGCGNNRHFACTCAKDTGDY